MQTLSKRGANGGGGYEQLLTQIATERVRDQIDCEASKLVTMMKQAFKVNR
jgi:hypothetical protein